MLWFELSRAGYNTDMSILFPNSIEHPDYRPIPSVILAAVSAGLPPVLLAALLAQAVPPPQSNCVSYTLASPFISGRTAWADLSADQLTCQIDWDAEEPHSEHETDDPTPKSIDTVASSSSSGPSVPFVPSYDSSNDVIRMHWRNREDAWRRAINASSHVMSGALLSDLASSSSAPRPE